jgi:hypothetical protein
VRVPTLQDGGRIEFQVVEGTAVVTLMSVVQGYGVRDRVIISMRS